MKGGGSRVRNDERSIKKTGKREKKKQNKMRLILPFSSENHNLNIIIKQSGLPQRLLESVTRTCQCRPSHVQSSAVQLRYDKYQSQQPYPSMMIESKNMIHFQCKFVDPFSLVSLLIFCFFLTFFDNICLPSFNFLKKLRGLFWSSKCQDVFQKLRLY